MKFRRRSVVLGWIPDFWCPSAKLALEIDASTDDRKRQRDALRDAALESQGIRTLHINAADIFRSPDAVKACIRAGLPPTEVPFLAREAIPIDGDGGESTRRTQGGVFLFGFDQDGDVRIGVLPDLEKSVVGSVGLRQVACKRVRSGEPQVR